MGSDDEERVELTASGGVEEASPGDVADADESVAKTTSESVKTESGWHEKYYIFMRQKYNLPRHYRLRTEEDTRKYSLWSVNFMILCSAVNTKMLNPNFAIMVRDIRHSFIGLVWGVNHGISCANQFYCYSFAFPVRTRST